MPTTTTIINTIGRSNKYFFSSFLLITIVLRLFCLTEEDLSHHLSPKLFIIFLENLYE
ncbi:hypothetical protein LEQ41_10745 [Streptococcus agalactiae]|nr:hypothetical protein [Streptococcus agalactiae]